MAFRQYIDITTFGANPAMQIFLNYARQDERKVKIVFDFLRATGHDPWMDVEKLVGGIEFESEIIRQIKQSEMFFVFLSRNSAGKRGIIQKEIRAALEKAQEFLPGDIFIVPIILDDCEVPSTLRKYNWVDMRDPGWKSFLTQTLSHAEQQRINTSPGALHHTYNAMLKTLGNSQASAFKIEPVISDISNPFQKPSWIAFIFVAGVLVSINIFALMISGLFGAVVSIVVMIVAMLLFLNRDVRGNPFQFYIAAVVSIGAAVSIYINVSRVHNHTNVSVEKTQPVQAPADIKRDLIVSAAAIEACNLNLSFECMRAGGVHTAETAGRNFLGCKTADLFRSDFPNLKWKDVWTTSVYSYAPGGGGPGGGRDDELLKVGGWADEYFSLIEFTLPPLTYRPRFAAIVLYSAGSSDPKVGGTRLAVDRIAAPWDFPKGERLWWKDKPRVAHTDMVALPAPDRGQWYMIELTELITGWLEKKYPNYGIQITPLETNNNYAFFASSDARDKGKYPRLLFCP